MSELVSKCAGYSLGCGAAALECCSFRTAFVLPRRAGFNPAIAEAGMAGDERTTYRLSTSIARRELEQSKTGEAPGGR